MTDPAHFETGTPFPLREGGRGVRSAGHPSQLYCFHLAASARLDASHSASSSARLISDIGRPTALTCDKAGNLYVFDATPDRRNVRVYSPNGKFLREIGKPKKGETIFVSSAAGAVGQVVGQLAKHEGLRVIGSVGSDAKLDYIVNELGFDGGFNYQKEKPADAVARLAPDGIEDRRIGAVQDHLVQPCRRQLIASRIGFNGEEAGRARLRFFDSFRLAFVLRTIGSA